MKKFIVLVLLALSFTGCDPEWCVDYYIENKLDKNLTLRAYNGLDYVDQEIEQKSIKNQLSGCDMGSSPTIMEMTNDSIQVLINNIIKKTYYPNDTGKSIFKTQDRESWKLVESRKHYSKFVFEITEEDLQ